MDYFSKAYHPGKIIYIGKDPFMITSTTLDKKFGTIDYLGQSYNSVKDAFTCVTIHCKVAKGVGKKKRKPSARSKKKR